MSTQASSAQSDSLGSKIEVREIVKSRYPDFIKGGRPKSWDERREGVDIIKTTDGREVKLLSDGGQSTPAPGWTLILTGGEEKEGYRWTLYGIPSKKH